MKKILIIEDDLGIAEQERDYPEMNNFDRILSKNEFFDRIWDPSVISPQ